MTTIFICFILVAITCFVLYSNFKREMALWEYIVIICASPIIALLLNGAFKMYNVSDTEYLSSYVVKAVYTEPWNEYIHKTCSVTHCSGSGKMRHCHTTYYDCSYVKYHPEQYYVVTNTNKIYNITRLEYNKYVRIFDNEHFVEMNRNYHTIDGDAYQTNFDNNYKHVFTYTSSESYTNKVQASHSIYNFTKITEDEAKKYNLYDYPEIVNDKQISILSKDIKVKNYQQDIINRINGYLGHKKQVHVYVLLWKNKPKSISEYQKAYWTGGNKNELIVNIGLNSNNKIVWSNVYSWSDKKLCENKIRNYINSNKGKKLYFNKLGDNIFSNVKNYFVRKNFHDFDYLDIELTTTQIVWAVIINFICTIILSIIFINNDSYNENYSYSSNTSSNSFMYNIIDKIKNIGYSIKKWFKNLISKLYW